MSHAQPPLPSPPKRFRVRGKGPPPAAAIPPAASTPAAKRLRLSGKQTVVDPATALFAALATAEELAHPGQKFAAPTVRRKHVHWTHGRSGNPAHVQPSAMTKAELWAHLMKVYKDVYPDPASPTGSILAFGLVAEETYAAAAPGLSPTHKHAPTFSTEQHYWNKVAKHSLQVYGVKLNAVAHDSYTSMYAYVRQATAKKPLHLLDAEPFFSKYHPKDDELSVLLSGSGKAAAMNSVRWAGAADCAKDAPRARAPRLFDVIRDQGLRTTTALQAYAQKEASEGRTELAELCTRQGAKLNGYLRGALAVLDAPQRLTAQNMTRLDKLEKVVADVACVCSGAWLPGAQRILTLNGINPDEFCAAVWRALDLGARRGVNVGCVGAAGCGKSTLLEPLEFVFDTLGKPQKGSSFALGNLPGCDVALWQDYEHDEDTVSFTDLLSILVGETIELRAPGELNRKFRNKAPFFYSGRVPLQCVRRDLSAAVVLNGMMSERFVTFEFSVPLPKRERRADWVHCAKCCASFYLRGAGNATTGATSSTTPVAPAAAPVASPPGVTLPLLTGAPSGSPTAASALVAELQALKALHSDGTLNDSEFTSAKRMLLGM